MKIRYTFSLFFVLVTVFLCSRTAYAENIPLQDKIDQMIMIGFRGMDVGNNSDIEKILNESNVGGVILFDYDTNSKTYDRNIKNKEQVKELTAELQAQAKTKLFIAIDQEGGLVNRLKYKYGFPIFQSPRFISRVGIFFAYRQYTLLANELSDIGVNINFGPVVDVATIEKGIINKQKRIYSDNPNSVSYYAYIMIKSLKDKKILSVAKHYPGLGDLIVDTHHTIGIIPHLHNYAMIPYQQLIKSKILDAVMVGHIVVDDIDHDLPASLSTRHMNNLRNNLGFDGIIFTDDMEMKALTNTYSLKDRVTLAINAGNTVLVFSNNMGDYDPNLFFKIRNIIMEGVMDGSIPEVKINDAYTRIMEIKHNF